MFKLIYIKKKAKIFRNCCIFSTPILSGTVLSHAPFYKLNIHVSNLSSYTQTGYWWQSSDRVWFHLPCAPTNCCSHTLWIRSCSLHTPRRVMTLQSWTPVTRFLFINVVCSKIVTKTFWAKSLLHKIKLQCGVALAPVFLKTLTFVINIIIIIYMEIYNWLIYNWYWYIIDI